MSQLCAKSKIAWEAWKDGGRPNEGPLFEAKCSTRKEVKKRIKLCSAMEERKRVQRREHLFRMNAHSRFKLLQKRKNLQCTRLHVDGRLIPDPVQLLEAWTSHFEELAQSRTYVHTDIQDVQQKLSMLASKSFQKEEPFLDVPFSVEEVECILQKMKMKKASGPDDLTTKHLRYGGLLYG